MSINYSTIATLIDNDISVIAVQFDEYAESCPKTRTTNSTKEYHYKTALKDLKKGDLVVVQCSGASSNMGYCVVRVAQVNCDLDYDTGIKYKWAVQKLDLESVDILLEKEEAIINKVKDLQKAAKRAALIDALGISASLRLSLSEEVKGKVSI